jgi:hypothetical protein
MMEPVQSIDLIEGALVKVTSPDNFAKTKLGVYMGRCKKDGGYRVHLTDAISPFREVCIVPERGDTIARITK